MSDKELAHAKEVADASPLHEASPRSLDELFAAEPDTLTDEDIHRMVLELRDNRKTFVAEKAAKVKGGNTPIVATGGELLDLLGLTKKK